MFKLKKYSSFARKKRSMKKSFSTFIFLLFLFQNNMFAQADNQDFMRSIGKMYVVYGVIVVIFLILVLFLVFLDRRLTKLENQINEK